MKKTRLEAFSDGVIAVILTIMVLELAPPHGITASDMLAVIPGWLRYALSFVYVGIYWVNHHALFERVERVDWAALWANLHLLFWLSLVPLVTAWAGNYPLTPAPMALYGVVLLMCAVAFRMLVRSLVANEGPDSPLAQALGHSRKKELSIALYLVAIGMSLWYAPAGAAIYVAVAILWLIPQRRKETPE